ncbi:hypothetical protein ACE6H2_010818 [Prunus campanulata]
MVELYSRDMRKQLEDLDRPGKRKQADRERSYAQAKIAIFESSSGEPQEAVREAPEEDSQRAKLKAPMKRAPPTPVFPNSSYHHGTASNFAEAIPNFAEARPNRVVLLGGMIDSKLTPADHWHIAHMSDKVAVDESHTFTTLHAVSATNLGLRLLARTQECVALSEEVASLKAMVADLQKRLYCANQHVEALQRKNEDHVELLQILQVRDNRGKP